jgi:hypothetical protein
MAWSSKVSLFSPVWSKPTASTFKINYDITIREQFSTQSAICRDSTGAIIQCFVKISSPCSAIYGEASAALRAA